MNFLLKTLDNQASNFEALRFLFSSLSTPNIDVEPNAILRFDNINHSYHNLNLTKLIINMTKRLFTLLFVMLLTNAVMAQFSVKGIVKDAKTNAPMQGVTVSVVGKAIGTTTSSGGEYVLKLSKGSAQVRYSFVGYGSVTKSITISASDVTEDVSLEPSTDQLAEVIVVGSRASQRTATDTPLPIDILSAQELKTTGQTSFDKALQYRVPSFNTVSTPVNDATSLLDPYEIRNMGPSRTLILINGKRKNTSALMYIQTSPGRGESGADIAAIPQQAIKRVEILRDGASAQYGSDAIAGVMNIILKDKFEYGSATLSLGTTHKGDGNSLSFAVNNGASFGEKGYLNYTIEFNRTTLANRPGMVSAEAEADANLGFDAPLATVKSFLAQKPDAGNINGQPENTAAKFLINGGFPLTDKAELYFNGAYVYKKVNSFANYRTPYWRTTDDGLLTPAGQPYMGYVPTFQGDLNDYNATIGLKSTHNGWSTDLSFTTGGNKQLYTVSNSRNRDLGKNSPTYFKPGGYQFTNNIGNIDISKQLSDKLSFAFGSEFRMEEFTVYAGDTASYFGSGADSFPGTRPGNAGIFSRFNFGGYVDLSYDITKDFLINGTLRQERYSDFGDATVYKISSRYKFNDDKITLRGSFVTLDYYNIVVKDRIVLGSEISGTASGNTALDQILVKNGIVAVSFFSNALNTVTSGLDYVVSLRNIELGSGKLAVNLAGNYTFENKYTSITNTKLIADAGKSVFDRTQDALLFQSRPKYKTILGLDYTVKGININLNNTLFGTTHFHQNGLDANTDTEFVPAVLTDLAVSIPLSKDITFNFNVNNILNVMPKWDFIDLKTGVRTRYDASNNVPSQKYFDQYNLITFNGRYSNVTYDGSQFSQLGTTFQASLNVKF